MPTAPQPCALLVELRGPDRYRRYRADLFPYLQGLALAHGIRAPWLTVPIPRETMHVGVRYVVGLPAPLAGELTSRVAALRPGVILLNDRPSEGLRALLRAAAPDARIVDLTEAPRPVGGRGPAKVAAAGDAVIGSESTTSAAAWGLLGGPGAPPSGATGFLVDAVHPTFDREVLATGVPDDPEDRLSWRLLVTPTCAYRRTVRTNPFYRDLDCPSAHAHRGCAFCNRHATASRATKTAFKTPLAVRALQQIVAHQAAEPSPDARFEYIFEECDLSANLGAFLDAVLARGVRPSTFVTFVRVDTLLRQRRKLEAILPALEAAGHRLAFLSVGAENFSVDENLRMNKGITPDQLWEGVSLMQALRARHPRTFLLPEKGFYAAILFTPWTRPEDLRTNIEVARRLGPVWLETALGTRLQLWEGAAITDLARHDGLVTDAPGTIAELDAVCISTPGIREVPWRFRDRRVEAAFRYLIRLDPLPFQARIADDDPLLASLRGLRASLPPRRVGDGIDLALAIVDAFETLGPDADTAAVFDHVRANLADRVLLVEVDPGRPPLAPLLPWICGLLEAQGRAHRWIRSDDAEALEREVRAFAPTHVLLTEATPRALLDRIAAAAPRASVRTPGGDPARAASEAPTDDVGCGRVCWRDRDPRWIQAWLGDPPDPAERVARDLVANVSPSWAALAPRADGRASRSIVVLPARSACDCLAMRERIAGCENLDFARCPHDQGCDSCSRFRSEGNEPPVDLLALASDWVRRFAETARPDGPVTFDVRDPRLAARLDALADLAVALGLPPSRFAFDVGGNLPTALPRLLARALPALEAAGHGVDLHAETFVALHDARDAATERLPRRIAPAVAAALRDLADRHPASLALDLAETPIACTPWTPVDRLAAGLARGVSDGLDPRGPWLCAVLPVRRGSPWAGALRRDGLDADAFEDASVAWQASARGEPESGLAPWRFRDPRTAFAIAASTRFLAGLSDVAGAAARFDEDPLYAAIRTRRAGHPRADRPDLFARELSALLTAESTVPASGPLLDAAFDRLRSADATVRPPEVAVPDRASRLGRILAALRVRLGPAWSGLVVADVRELEDASGYDIDLSVDGRPYVVRLQDPSRTGFARTPRMSLSPAAGSPAPGARDAAMIERFLEVVDRILSRRDADLLPRGSAP